MGLPGSGKTYLARQLAKAVAGAVVSAERIRHELLEQASFSDEEEAAVKNMMLLLSEQLLAAGLSVAFDTSASSQQERRQLREFARQHQAKPLTIWQQLDSVTAWERCRDRAPDKNPDDRFAPQINADRFQQLVDSLEEPKQEDVIVASGKHSFKAQSQVIIRRLLEMQLVETDHNTAKTVPKPGMINLVAASPGRVDHSRRNISIHKP